MVGLDPGKNTVGRSAANTIQVDHPTVSDAHCEIELGSESAIVRDLGSTNGTFVRGEPVREAVLHSGEKLRVGEVEFTLELPAPPVACAAQPGAADGPIVQSTPVHAELRCANHIQTRAAWTCPDCQRNWCVGCVSQVKLNSKQSVTLCKACNGVCERAGSQLKSGHGPATFVAGLLYSLRYPFSGNGPFMLVAATIAQAAISFAGGLFFVVGIALGAYICIFMRNVILTSSRGDLTLPNWPDLDLEDVRGAAFQFFGVGLISFGPSLLAAFWSASDPELARNIRYGLWGAGACYFPMALLAVVIYDDLAALNPVLVVVSIFKTPLRYLSLLLFLGAVFGGSFLLDFVLPTTGVRVMTWIVTGFAGIYTSIVAARAIGWFYHCGEDELGWK